MTRKISAGKKPKPSATMTREELYNLVWRSPLGSLAQVYGITGNGLAKICDRMMIPHPPRGYWAGGGRGHAPPPLPAAPPDLLDDRIVISSRQRALSRRSRTRLSTELRREEMIAIATVIIKAEGLNSISIKRVAQEVGVSEALVQNYFPTLKVLLVSLARRETAEMNASIDYEMSRFTAYEDRAQASASGYLNYVAAHGGLLQILLNSPDVRAALRPDYESRRSWGARSMAARLSQEHCLDLDQAAIGTQVLRAVTVRAGKLLAEKKLELRPAKRLSQTMIREGRRRLIEQGGR